MSVEMVIELKEKRGIQSIISAIDTYKIRLHAGIMRSQHRIAQFEQKYGISSAYFLEKMSSEDMHGGDMEYIEWAGEAKLLIGLQDELSELEYAHYQLP